MLTLHLMSVPTTDGVVLNVQDSSTGFGNNYPACDWQWILTVSPCMGDITCLYPDTVPNPTFNFDLDDPATAIIAFQVTSCNGCTATAVKSFPVQELSFNFNPAADSICFGETVPLLQSCDTSLTYTWVGSGICPDCGTDGCAVAYPGISSDYYVTVTDGLCTLTDSTHIGVQQHPISLLIIKPIANRWRSNFKTDQQGTGIIEISVI
jgi:hypothetical protein